LFMGIMGGEGNGTDEGGGGELVVR
jgi:hypothetical protein